MEGPDHQESVVNSNHATLSPSTVETRLTESMVVMQSTTVDGSTGLTTATTARMGYAVRSRSRSPHPAGTPSSREIDQEPDQRQQATGQDGNTDIREASVDIQSSFASPSNGSRTDISIISDHDRVTKHAYGTLLLDIRSRITMQWEASKGLLMVLLAMFFGASMGATARLMETGPNPMHTFQILFARMSITAVMSMAYMKWKKIPNAPLGPPGVRKILVARGVGGFFGVFGLYYSVKYLPLGEATVITFLAPMVANGVCSVLLKEPFTKREQLAGVISLIGVIFIARPTSFFASNSTAVVPTADLADGRSEQLNDVVSEIPEASPVQRLIAVLVDLLGVCGAACAYTTIRWIGKRAHPLISVNYFSVWCTFVSLMALLVVPGVSFRLPASLREWGLLISLGTFGMVMQFFLTAGLARQKGSAATNMTYTQMIFVLLIDYLLWGTVLTWSSWLGCVLILGSQIWGAMARGEAMKDGVIDERGPGDLSQRMDEEVGLVETVDCGQSDGGESMDEIATHVEMAEIPPTGMNR